VVFGDLGTSPLYVFYNTFPHGINDPEDVVGALSLIIYSLTLVPLLKYVFVVCRANDSGQGKPNSTCRFAPLNSTVLVFYGIVKWTKHMFTIICYYG